MAGRTELVPVLVGRADVVEETEDEVVAVVGPQVAVGVLWH